MDRILIIKHNSVKIYYNIIKCNTIHTQITHHRPPIRIKNFVKHSQSTNNKAQYLTQASTTGIHIPYKTPFDKPFCLKRGSKYYLINIQYNL